MEEASNKRMASSYLFCGLPGIGKKKVAEELISKLWGVPVNPSHPDFFFISPNNSSSIQIERIRSLRVWLSRASLMAPIKAVILDEAHKMTTGAANSLLKTLEEPPVHTLLILITSSLYQILPTIRSRCRLLHFEPPPFKASISFMMADGDMSEENIRMLLQYSDGSLKRAKEIKDYGFEEAITKFQELSSGLKKSFRQISHQAEEWVQKEGDLVLLLQMIKKHLWNEMRAEDHWNYLEKMDQISRAQRNIEANVNKTLVLENLLMEIL